MRNEKDKFTEVTNFETSIVAPVVQIKVAPDKYETIDRSDVYLELHVYDLNDNLIASDYNVADWRYDKNVYAITFDILKELFELDFKSGRYKVKFRLYQNLVGNNNTLLYIDEIGSSKTEIRVRPYTDSEQLISEFLDFFLVEKKDKYGRTLQPHINLKKDRLFRIVNWQPDFLSFSDSPYSLVLKLEEPLPDDITTDDFLFITLPNSEQYDEIVNIESTNTEKPLNILANANFEAKAQRQTKKELDYHNWTTLVSTNQDVSSKILSKYFGTSLEGIQLNIDFRDFENFVFYSSAEARLDNFKYKLELIESYDNSINALYDVSQVSSSVTSSAEFVGNIEKYDNRKQDLIGSFDLYERHLYFESGSYYTGSFGEYDQSTWPKSNSTIPYTLYPVTSSEATAWYDGMIYSASLYDRHNKNALVKMIPEHIRNDEYSSDFEVFANLISQNFDVLYLYTQQFEKMYERQESLYEGIAKDLIYTLLHSYGWIADEEFKYDDLSYWDLGANSQYQFQTTSSYSVGEEVVFAASESMPRGDVSKEIWKRIWNNLPYLLKTKGTTENIHAIMSCYGVPRTLLDVREFGGPEKIDRKSYWVSDKFTYGLDFEGSDQFVAIPYRDLAYSNITPNAIELRFKTVDASQWGDLPVQYERQILMSSADESIVFYLEQTTGKFAKIKMYIEGTSDYTAETEEGPFLDGNWWHFAYRHNEAIETISAVHTFDMYAMKSKYDELTHAFTGSFTIDGGTYSTNLSNLFGDQNWYIGGEEHDIWTSFTGQMQEFRMWSEPLEYEAIVNHALSPTSFVGNDPTGSFDTLAFRLPMGTDLRKYDHSIIASQSLANKCPNQISSTFKDGTYRSGSATNFPVGNDYTPVYETYSTEWPDISANRRISNKVRIDPNQLTGDLSLYDRVDSAHYDSFPNDSPKIGVYLSPTNEVDEDIAEQMGGFRIDDYIGEWDDIYRSYYKGLNELRRQYFKKFTSKYDVRDYLRLARFFNNSMFKQIKQSLPARANKLVGIVIEPHILNRSKINLLNAPPQLEQFLKEGILQVVQESGSGDENYYEGGITFSEPIASGLANAFTGSVGMTSYGFLDSYISIGDYNFDTWSNTEALQAFIYESRTSTQFGDTVWTFASSSIMYANAASTTDESGTIWTDGGRATGTPDTSYANAMTTVVAQPVTQKLILSDFQFEIPNNVNVTKIKLFITRKKTETGATGDVTDHEVKLKSGYKVSNNVGHTMTGWPLTPGATSYEGDSNYWKAIFTPAEINSSGFSVDFKGNTTGIKGVGTVGHSIDAIGIQIEYYIPTQTYSDVSISTSEGIENLYFKGTRQYATDINVPSTETPDGGPIVEVNITDTNEISIKNSDSDGNLDVK